MANTVISFGFLLPTREVVMAQESPDFRQVIDLAERAEVLGFDSVWVGDSVLALPRLEALTLGTGDCIIALSAGQSGRQPGSGSGPDLCRHQEGPSHCIRRLTPVRRRRR